MLADVLIFTLGVAMLVAGAWALVSGGSRLATALGVPPVLVGLTVVAWGTSAPELVVSLTATLRGSSDIMMGNLIGSNVANVGLILGVTLLLVGPPGDRSLWRLEMPVLLLGTILFGVFASNGVLGPVEGAVLMTLFGFVTIRSISSGLGTNGDADSPSTRGRGIMMGSILTVVGAGGLILGGRWIVDSASNIARALGASEVVIGLTLVAVGTSLPELAATLMAAARRESGIALGNVVGSNLFNLLAVGGPVAIISDVRFNASDIMGEMWGLAVMTLALALVLALRGRIHRAFGAALLILYAVSVVRWIA